MPLASYKSGFAPRDGRPRYPSLWRGCVGAWCPSLGPSGGVLREWSGFQDHATLTNMDVSSVWTNYGLTFDGSNDYCVVSPNVRHIASRMTVALWVKFSATPSTYDGLIGATNNDSWSQGWGCHMASASTVKMWFGAWHQSPNAMTIDTTKWNHVAATTDSASRVRMFVNGVMSTWEEDTGTGLLTGAGTWNLYLGAMGLTSYNLAGQLDDIRIYSRDLRQAEIAILARRPRIAYELAPKRYGEPAVAGNRRRRYLIGCS